MNKPGVPYQTGLSVWYGSNMKHRKAEWLWQLSKHEILELERAAELALHKNNDIGKLTIEQFSLDGLESKLVALRQELIHGRGFSLIRGLPIHRYTQREAAAIFYGIGLHIGNPRSQNAKGHIIGHVKDMGVSSSDPNVRLYQTRERQTFHTDSTDVVGLICLQPAKSGGQSLLVSAHTVFNELYKQKPDLLQLLMEPIATDRRGEVPEGMLPYLLIPVFSFYKNKITIFYQRQYIESAQRFGSAPRLTEKHFEALDWFDNLCNDPNLHLPMMLEKGDMQFVYNHNMLHDRTGFEDFRALNKRRHLLRLWLSVPGDRALPEEFATRFGSVEVGNRGGIVVPGTQFTFPLAQ